MKTIQKTLFVCLLVCSLSACKSEEVAPQEDELQKYSNMAIDAGFNTIYAYTEYGTDEAAMEDNYTLGLNMFSSYNDLFDIYNGYDNINNLKTINDNAGKEAVVVDEAIIEMLLDAKEMYELSDGKFDVTMGAVLQVWHNYREKGMELNEKDEPAPIPTQEELDAVSACRGWDKIEIDEENKTVYINDPCVSLDVGGIAKGYAAEKIAQAIEEKGIVYGDVNAGRNIRTMHTKPNDAPWRIGVVHPDGENSIVVVDSHEECSYVTSGDSERFYIGEDGKRYHHIISTETLWPADYYRSVSIITLDSTVADALSTTLFTIPIEDGKKVLEKYKEVSGQDVSAVWVVEKDKTQNEDGKEVDDYVVIYTDDLEDRLIWPHS